MGAQVVEQSSFDDPVDLTLALVRLSEKSRRQGLLSLEGDAEQMPDETLREALQELVDRTGSGVIARIMDARIAELSERLEDERQRQILRLRLIKTGVLQLEDGAPPRLIAALLGARLSPEERRRIEEGLPGARQYASSPRPAEDAPGLTLEDLEHLRFEDVLKMRRVDVQRLVRNGREIDLRELMVALRGASPEVTQKFMDTLTKRVAAQFAEDMEVMWPVPLSEIEAARQRIVETIRRLVREREIGLVSPGSGADARGHS